MTINRERAAMAMAEATMFGQATAAKKFGITAKTIAGYFKRVDGGKDLELTALFAARLAELRTGWAVDADAALRKLIRKAMELAEDAKTIGDMPDILAALRTIGELRISHEALIFDATDRQGPEATPTPAGDGETSPAIH